MYDVTQKYTRKNGFINLMSENNFTLRDILETKEIFAYLIIASLMEFDIK